MRAGSRAARAGPRAAARGCGGQPRMCRSTGTTAETPPTHGVAAGEQAAVDRAVADRHHPFRIGRRLVGALQRLAHVLGHRPGDQQHVGVARRGDEAQAEALEVVEGVVERVDLQLAAVAGAGIDLADREAAAEPPARGALDAGGELGQRRVVGPRRRARSAAAGTGFEEQLAHGASLEVVARVGAVERFVAEREVGDDVALDRRLQQRPLEPRRIAQVAALDRAVGVEPQPDQDVAAERLPTSAMPSRPRPARQRRAGSRPGGQPLEDLLDQRQALLDLADADPHPRVDVAVARAPAPRSELVVGRIARGPARIEGAARGAADVAAGAESPRQLGASGCRCRRCDPAARRCCRRARPARESGAGSRRSARAARRRPSRPRSAATPPGTTRSIISRWPKQASAARSTRSRSTPQWACISAKEASLQMAPMSPK